jgi:hypothetical protein
VVEAMSRQGPSRRLVTFGGAIATALGLTAIGVTVPGLLRHRHRKTPYDDVLNTLVDRDTAVKVGAAMSTVRDKSATADKLRARLRDKTLEAVTTVDIADGRLIEVKGWVLPETLATLCALADSVER